ncbi:hypothetical protein V6N13_072834 [Hibiscus sabdariffa]|uniref:Uncharacterized protein n=1 Tax=Hibiscus sabdariffa TaxID=183260 RepID=A0ABR2EAV6_9ROSI
MSAPLSPTPKSNSQAVGVILLAASRQRTPSAGGFSTSATEYVEGHSLAVFVIYGKTGIKGYSCNSKHVGSFVNYQRGNASYRDNKEQMEAVSWFRPQIDTIRDDFEVYCFQIAIVIFFVVIKLLFSVFGDSHGKH